MPGPRTNAVFSWQLRHTDGAGAAGDRKAKVEALLASRGSSIAGNGAAAGTASRGFDDIDSNGDGVIDRKEWAAAQQRSQSEIAAPPAAEETRFRFVESSAPSGERRGRPQLAQVPFIWHDELPILTREAKFEANGEKNRQMRLALEEEQR